MTPSEKKHGDDKHGENEKRACQAAGELRIVAVNAITGTNAAAWDACANPAADQRRDGAEDSAPSSDQEIAYNPFLSHAFLAALEASKSVGGRSGWHVQHILVHSADGALVAAAPCYLKSHSHGEYVFDHGWAEAYAHAGGSYYPKLQVAVPFTPATGARLLVRTRMRSARPWLAG